jgi:putative two-component system response regulator
MTSDNATDEMVKEVLAPFSYTFLNARDVENAYYLCMRGNVDLVVTCDRGEGFSGLDLCRKIKSDRRTGNTAVLIILENSTPEKREKVFRVGGDDYLATPVESMELRSRVRNQMRIRVLQAELEEEKDMLSTRLRERSIELEKLTQGLVASLERANALNDDDTGSHIIRVCHTGEHIARALGLSTDFCGRIRRYASLHDIGKVGLPDRILKKEGPLTDAEREEMKLHTVYGYELLKTANAEQVALNIAYAHHERFDGTGYPRGLSKEQIPIEARIVALVDVYDALRSARCYKPAFSELKSLDILRQGRGTHFDPKVLDAFLGELATIREIRDQTPDQPPSLQQEPQTLTLADQ